MRQGELRRATARLAAPQTPRVEAEEALLAAEKRNEWLEAAEYQLKGGEEVTLEAVRELGEEEVLAVIFIVTKRTQLLPASRLDAGGCLRIRRTICRVNAEQWQVCDEEGVRPALWEGSSGDGYLEEGQLAAFATNLDTPNRIDIKDAAAKVVGTPARAAMRREDSKAAAEDNGTPTGKGPSGSQATPISVDSAQKEERQRAHEGLRVRGMDSNIDSNLELE